MPHPARRRPPGRSSVALPLYLAHRLNDGAMLRKIDIGDGLTAVEQGGKRPDLLAGEAAREAVDALGITDAERRAAAARNFALRGGPAQLGRVGERELQVRLFAVRQLKRELRLMFGRHFDWQTGKVAVAPNAGV